MPEEFLDHLTDSYARLTWPEKANLLRAIIEAGDHPPGFEITFKVERCTPAEQQYLKDIGIGPFGDGGVPDAR